MRSFWKYNLTLILTMLSICSAQSQDKLSKGQLDDLVAQATERVMIFFNAVGDLGGNILTNEQESKIIGLIVEQFTPNGTVEEKSKYAKKPINRRVRDYLNVVKMRGDGKIRVVEYDIVDNLTTDELIPTTNPDGTITYKGDITVSQFLCKKKSNTLDDNEIGGCEYQDTTIKKVYIEIKKATNKWGRGWAVFIDRVQVLNVK